jgi:tetratricopeptide (TPR) repeat protein
MKMKTKSLASVLIIELAVILLSAMSCQNTKDTKKTNVGIYYLTLFRKPGWSPADRNIFINLFSTRGMNKLFQLNGVSSFEEFQNQRYMFLEANCDFNEFDPSFQYTSKERASELSRTTGADIKIMRPVWYKVDGEKLSPYSTQIVLWNGLIHDLHTIPMIKKERIHPLLGVIMLILLILQTMTARRNVSKTQMSRGGIVTVMLIAVCLNGAIMYGLYRLGGTTFKKISYEPIQGSEYQIDLSPIEEPYFGEPALSIIDNAKKSVERETVGLLNSAGRRKNVNMAQSFLNRAMSLSAHSDPQSLNRAISYLSRAIDYQFKPDAFLELANCYMLLAQNNVNTLLNLVRAEAILNTIPSQTGFREYKNEISMLLASVKYLLQEKNTAIALVEKADNLRFNMNSSEKYWEAKYLIEKDANTKIDYADELIRLSPDNPRYYLYKGVAASLAGNNHIAFESLERATKMNASYVLAKDALEKLNMGDLTPLFESFKEEDFSTESSSLPFHNSFVYADALTMGTVDAESTIQVADLDKLYPKGPIMKYGLAGVLGLRKSNIRRILGIIVFLFLANFLVTLFAMRLSQNNMSMGAISFWCLVLIIAFYTLSWGISTKIAWIYIFLTYSMNAQAIRNIIK